MFVMIYPFITNLFFFAIEFEIFKGKNYLPRQFKSNEELVFEEEFEELFFWVDRIGLVNDKEVALNSIDLALLVIMLMVEVFGLQLMLPVLRVLVVLTVEVVIMLVSLVLMAGVLVVESLVVEKVELKVIIVLVPMVVVVVEVLATVLMFELVVDDFVVELWQVAEESEHFYSFLYRAL